MDRSIKTMAIPVLRFKAGTAWPKPDRQALIALSAHAEVEVYPGTHHGFAFPKRPVYNRAAAERHWERLLARYRRNLQA